MDDLPLDGLERLQLLHGLEVVEGHAEVVGEGGGRRLVDGAEHLGLGVDEQQGAVRRPVAAADGNGQAAGVLGELQALEEAAVAAVEGEVVGAQHHPAAHIGADEAGQRRAGETVDLADRHAGGGDHVDPVSEARRRRRTTPR